jgi:hypothetical protein
VRSKSTIFFTCLLTSSADVHQIHFARVDVVSGVRALAQNAAPNPSAKPNIVFILMDNLGYGEVGCYGGGILRGAATPNID